jgi:hypothetical protein
MKLASGTSQIQPDIRRTVLPYFAVIEAINRTANPEEQAMALVCFRRRI